MTEFLDQIFECVADLSPNEVVGALGVALLLSLAATGVYALGRRGVSRPLTPVCGLMILISVASMGLSAVHVRSRVPGPRAPGAGASATPGRLVLLAADSDEDGRLTPREAVEFVRAADTSRKGFADSFDIDHAPKFDASHTAAPSPGPRELALACDVPAIPPDACYPPSGGETGHERPLAWFPRSRPAANPFGP